MPRNPAKTAVITVSLPVPMAKQIERIRKAAHRTRSEVVREALGYYFRAQPDIEEPAGKRTSTPKPARDDSLRRRRYPS